MKDIRSVAWDKQVPEFHLNTKLAHLVVEGCLDVPGWRESCEKFASCLPETTATCGSTGKLVDPFEGLKRAFPSNRTGALSDIVNHVNDMWSLAEASPATRHTSLQHGNLVEILENSGILPAGTSRKFYLEVLGLASTPSDELESLEDGCQGEFLAGNSSLREIVGGGRVYQNLHGRTYLWEQGFGEMFLSMEGCGCVCRWQVLFDGASAVVIQDADATHTSVTNMAEQVRDACRHHLGEKIKCYEFYAPHKDVPASVPCEIIGEKGEAAGWIPTSVSNLPQLEAWLLSKVSASAPATAPRHIKTI